MKKILALSMLLSSSILFVPAAEAKTGGGATALAGAENPQINIRIGPQRRYRRMRVVTRTRIVRRGFRTYRETWQYRYFPNGRVTSRLISRVRIR
ncbi:MAG: hypothetical protein JSS81_24840 [Acidobacteria bacterium]|nr:hypothetical protein [Acidobacteriota bacterium]